MQNLLYWLQILIPNLGEAIAVIGCMLAFYGLANAFFGYRIFKFVLSVTGFLIGAVIGFVVFLNTKSGIADRDKMILFALIGGIIGASVIKIFHSLGVFITVGAMSAIIVFLFTQNSKASLILGIICGIIGIFLEKATIIISTAICGGIFTAEGIWLVRLSNGESSDVLFIGTVISIGGLAFQWWLEKRKTGDKEDTEDKGSGFLEIIAAPVVLIALGVSALCNIRPKEFLHNLIYKKDSDEVKPGLIKSLIGLPFLVGLILGVLFRSAELASAIIVISYILVMIQFIRKRRGETSSEEYIPKYKWEKWVNKVLDNNLFILIIPMIPGMFIAILVDESINETYSDLIGILLFFLIGVAIYIIFFKALPKAVPEKPTSSQLTAENADSEKDKAADVQQDTVVIPEEETMPEAQKKTSGKGKEQKSGIMFCYKCGSQLPDGAKFCQKCGTKVMNEDVIKEIDTLPTMEQQNTNEISNKQKQSQISGKKTEKKKSKRLLIILGVAVLGVIAIIIALNWNDKIDYISTVGAYTPFANSQGLPYTCEEVLNQYIDSPEWKVREIQGAYYVDISGTLKDRNDNLIITFQVSLDPDDPDRALISPDTVMVNDMKTATENEAVTFLYNLFCAYDEGYRDLSWLNTDTGEIQEESEVVTFDEALHADYEEAANSILLDWFDRHPLMQNIIVQFMNQSVKDENESICLVYEMYMAQGRYGIFNIDPDSGEMTMDSFLDNDGHWSSVQVSMDQWYLEYYWGITDESGCYLEQYGDSLYAIYDREGSEILEYNAVRDSYAICDWDLYCSVICADGVMVPTAEISIGDFVGEFGFDGSFEEEGYYNNFYYSLEIEKEDFAWMVTESWRGNYLIDNVWVTADDLIGNTLIFTAFSEDGLIPETHYFTYFPAAESPLGKDTIYLDGEYDMPFVREEFME